MPSDFLLPTESAASQGGVSIVNPLAIPDWDARLQRFPSATIFYTAAWARVLHDTYGFTPVNFVAGGPEHPQALLPAMEVNSWLTGRRGISLPFTDECEPLCQNAAIFRDLFGQIRAHGKSRGWKYWECRGGRSGFDDVAASTSYWGHRLDLQASESTLFARTKSSVRRAVRKAEQNGLTVEFSQELGAVRGFHQLLGRTRRRQGLPVQPFAFFGSIHRHLLARNQGWVVLARRARKLVAGAVFFHFGGTAYYKYGASDEQFQHLRPNNLVMWAAIKHYASEGCAKLDFGRTSLGNGGLRRFKLRWGARESRVDYVRHDLRTGGFVTALDESSGWYNHVFRTVPVFLSRLIGAMLYRHIA